MENASVHHEDLTGGLTTILEEENIYAERVFSRDRQTSNSSVQFHLEYGKEDRVSSMSNPLHGKTNKARKDSTNKETASALHSSMVATPLAQSEQEANAIEQRRTSSVIEEEKNEEETGDHLNGQSQGAESDGWKTIEREKKSYFSIAFLYIFYNIAFTMTIPALPALMLRLNNDNSSRSSYFYGLAVFVRYIIEFFFAPMLGSMEDLYGRKIMLFLSFVICAMEFIFLSFFPSIAMIFITRAMAGSLDSALPTSYTIVTDLAVYNGDNVTRKFGLLGAMSGIGYILGPIVGGYLVSISIELCFLVAAGCTVAGAVFTLILLEETVHLNVEDFPTTLNNIKEENEPGVKKREMGKCNRCVRFQDFNPIPALILHFSNHDLRELTVPLATSSLTLGIGFIWYIFMDFEFHSTSTSIGYYLAFYGVINAFIQGVLIKRLIPKYISEMQASVYGLIFLGIQVVGYGLSWEEWMLYVMVFLFTIGNISDPALKALIVKESLRQPNGAMYQGNLQGVLCSIRTLGSAFGSLIFSSMFAYCVEQHPALPYVPFLFAGFLYFISALYLTLVFRKSDKWLDTAALSKRKDEIAGLEDGNDENSIHQSLLDDQRQ